MTNDPLREQKHVINNTTRRFKWYCQVCMIAANDPVVENEKEHD